MRTTSPPGRRELLAERRRLRRRYKAQYDDLAEILFTHDPIHIASRRDEYEPEVGRILARAQDAGSIDELMDVIHSVFVEMFDRPIAGDRARYEPIARDVWRLLRATPSPP